MTDQISEFSRRKDWHYDLSKSLDGIDLSSKPTVSLTDANDASFLSSTFIFRSGEGKAGEPSAAQLMIRSDAFSGSAPVQLSQVRIEFEGSLRPIILTHDPDSATSDELRGDTLLARVGLEVGQEETEAEEGASETLAPVRGAADLLLSPGQTRVYEMAIPLRDPGDAHAQSAIMSVENNAFSLDYTISFKDNTPGTFWLDPSGFRRKIGRDGAQHVHVEPRPPKMEIRPVNAVDQYYTNEAITLDFELVNAEDEDAVTKLDVHVFGEQVPGATVKVTGHPDIVSPPNVEASRLAGLSLGTINSSDKIRIQVCLDEVAHPASLEFNIKASYHLASDPGTRIVRKNTFTASVVSPFEANYEFLPRLHPDPWPSVFDPDTIRDTSEDDSTQPPLGLAQKWCLVCHYASFATENLQVVGLDAKVLSSTGGIQCAATERHPALPGAGLDVTPRAMHEAHFDVTARKLSLEDRGPATVDLGLEVRWRRPAGEAINVTTLLAPRFPVLHIEPRVLASLSPVTGDDGVLGLDVTIENPSSHFLTFGITMEPSDEFAFSGAKRTTVHVLPVSRRASSFRLLPLVRGAFIRPGLVVRDKYFQKVLRVLPTEGMKVDKEGLMIWVPGDEEEQESS